MHHEATGRPRISFDGVWYIIASGLASWGPSGPSSRERALTATGVSKERPKIKCLQPVFTVLDWIFRRLCSWALTSCFLISIVEVKVQSSPHTYREKSIVNVPDYRRCEYIHHLASRKIPCENISLAKLFKTKVTDSSFSLFLQHTWTTSKKFASVFIF